MSAFFDSEDFEDVIRKAVSLGGDSDTIAAICGSVAEAHYGGVPAPLRVESLARLDSRLRETVAAFCERFCPQLCGDVHP